ncbi:MAG: hypothetical protein HC874_26725 [Richelia sp. SL_2_1]|nr:hypothetical protein [Richelia sp. SM1_7_0]NJN12704.1 hypothetical protein [Richelia sp. RM1_1_1]NJO30740.1 hypothetical protein [Richelia sp. SL_2_1]
MSQLLKIREFAILLAVKNIKPNIHTLEFFKYTNTISNDWELARQPIYKNNVSQLIFTNGVSIVVETNRVMFLEIVEDKAVSDITIPDIARKYVDTLSNAEYEGIGINYRGYVPFNQEQDSAYKYLTQTLLSKGTWQEIGNAPMRASLNLSYQMENCQLLLGVTDTALQLPEKTSIPALIFSGSFSYEITGENVSERKKNLHQAIDNWQVDLNVYQETINTKFVPSTSTSTSTSENTTEISDLFVIGAAT